MENRRVHDESDLVRCLDCGTIYDLPREHGEAEPCPGCGGTGWIAVDAGRPVSEKSS
jgi:predicted RNA-binding Zn-ribbon protein involved in translation (DUF1610 family)